MKLRNPAVAMLTAFASTSGEAFMIDNFIDRQLPLFRLEAPTDPITAGEHYAIGRQILAGSDPGVVVGGERLRGTIMGYDSGIGSGGSDPQTNWGYRSAYITDTSVIQDLGSVTISTFPFGNVYGQMQVDNSVGTGSTVTLVWDGRAYFPVDPDDEDVIVYDDGHGDWPSEAGSMSGSEEFFDWKTESRAEDIVDPNGLPPRDLTDGGTSDHIVISLSKTNGSFLPSNMEFEFRAWSDGGTKMGSHAVTPAPSTAEIIFPFAEFDGVNFRKITALQLLIKGEPGYHVNMNSIYTAGAPCEVPDPPMAPSSDPPTAPPEYNTGPTSFQVSEVNLSAPERAAYALYEGVMMAAESVILATSCNSAKGSYDLEVYADGVTASRASNTVEVLSPDGRFDLYANLAVPNDFRGQLVTVNQRNGGKLDGVDINSYLGNFSFNKAGTIMTGSSSINTKGANGRYDAFTGSVIKDFYKGCVRATSSPPANVHDIFDWGLQQVSKVGYPVNKYWQRSKSRRDDGAVGHTVFVKDRLVGGTSCRIVVDTTGSNNEDFFSQKGTLSISVMPPGAAWTWFQ